MADIENGMYAGDDDIDADAVPTWGIDYVTAMLKGRHCEMALKGGNAQHGVLTTLYDGVRPQHNFYQPMRKEGGIILGTGGDNSRGAVCVCVCVWLRLCAPLSAVLACLARHRRRSRASGPTVSLCVSLCVSLWHRQGEEKGVALLAVLRHRHTHQSQPAHVHVHLLTWRDRETETETETETEKETETDRVRQSQGERGGGGGEGKGYSPGLTTATAW
eukprot:COSAG03_NODE_514_length_7269_cov_6.491353_3_plen_218_part_00